MDSQSKHSLLYKHIKRENSVELYVSVNVSKHLRSRNYAPALYI